MVLGYTAARIVRFMLISGVWIVLNVVWVLSGFDPFLLGVSIAWLAGLMIWVTVRYGADDLFAADALRSDLMEDLTGANPGDYGELSAHDLVERLDGDEKSAQTDR